MRIEEFTRNNDAWYLSLHVWKDEDGLLHLVPRDMDLSHGQPSYNDNEKPASWIPYRPDLVATFGAVLAFRARLAERRAELRGRELAEEAINARIDDSVETMGDAVERDFDRWPIEELDFGGTLYAVGGHDEEVARVRAWIALRLAWMDAQIGAW